MGELRALRWRDIDFAGHTIHVRAQLHPLPRGTAEVGKVRSVPLIDHAAAASTASAAASTSPTPSDLVFCNAARQLAPRRRATRASTPRSTLRASGTSASEDKPIVFHDLRHTFGTLAVTGVGPAEVQGYMGHADISTTMGYVHHVPKTTTPNCCLACLTRARLGAGSRVDRPGLRPSRSEQPPSAPRSRESSQASAPSIARRHSDHEPRGHRESFLTSRVNSVIFMLCTHFAPAA